MTVFLFGSRVHGRHVSRADADIGLLAESKLPESVFHQIRNAIDDSIVPWEVDIVDFTQVKSNFKREAINTRGLDQLQIVFEKLRQKASGILPNSCPDFGNLIALDGSLIDATLSMCWADYRKWSKKGKIHLGLDLNHGIPSKIFFTDGKGAERPFVDPITPAGHTVVADRGYQEHALFDHLQTGNKHFVIRIKASTIKTIVKANDVCPDSIVFFDAEVLLGTKENKNQSQKPVRLVGYHVDGVDYWIATDRRDLTAEQIAEVYKLRWNVENFFAWWKRHLRVYHLIARSKYGLMVQIYAGLITYLLLAIHCHKNHGEPVTIKRVRELRIKIQNELRAAEASPDPQFFKEQELQHQRAKT